MRKKRRLKSIYELSKKRRIRRKKERNINILLMKPLITFGWINDGSMSWIFLRRAVNIASVHDLIMDSEHLQSKS